MVKKVRAKGFTYTIRKLPSGKIMVRRSDARGLSGQFFNSIADVKRYYPNLRRKI
jgi:hypothetical protein